MDKQNQRNPLPPHQAVLISTVEVEGQLEPYMASEIAPELARSLHQAAQSLPIEWGGSALIVVGVPPEHADDVKNFIRQELSYTQPTIEEQV